MRAFLIVGLLIRQADAVRKIVGVQEALMQGHAEDALESNAVAEAVKAFEQETEAVNRFLSTLEMLKEDPENETLQSTYRSLIGEVEWVSPEEEAQATLSQVSPEEEEAQSTLKETPDEEKEATAASVPTPLGEMSTPGAEYNMVELHGGIAKRLGRMFTHRHDYFVETKGGESKYILQGKILSLHSRVHVLDAEGNKKFILRRSFSYLNPLAKNYGQYSYRVIKCKGEDCAEGDVLYTITKDRLGRGFAWAHDEWRVFTGLGGCGRYASGLFSCDKKKQILYSISSGLSHARSYDTKYYSGPIRTIGTTGHDTAYLYNGDSLTYEHLKSKFEVATSHQVSGPPRFLNWAHKLKALVSFMSSMAWSDAYHVTFTKPTDSLLVFLMQAVQDVTYDQRSGRE